MTELTSLEALTEAVGATSEKPAFIFKHSTACPISAKAHGNVAQYLKGAPDSAPEFYLIKVIESRPVSNAMAAELAVEHQSPQLLLVKAGKAVWSTSHHGITGEAIDGAIRKHLP